MLRGSVKGTGYTLHSPVSPSPPLPCVTVCYHISTGPYHSVQNLLCSRLLSKNIKIKIFNTIISLVVLHGCDTWSRIEEEHREGVFGNRVLRKVHGPKKDEVLGEWRKIHNEELHYQYSNQILL